jgi:hypothetical protein
VPFKQIRVRTQDDSHLEVVQEPELEKGGFLVEPYEAVVWPAWNKKCGLKYRIEFGKGATFRRITNCKNGALPVEGPGANTSGLSRIPPKRPSNWNECWDAVINDSKVLIHGKL